MKFLKYAQQIRHLKSTINTSYGPGALAWVLYFYYSFLRVNKFIIMKASLKDFVEEIGLESEIKILNLKIDDLKFLRSRETRLPREFFCDEFNDMNESTIVLINNNMVHIHWTSYKENYSRFFNIGSNSAEITYSTTIPEYRGFGIAVLAYNSTLKLLKSRGIENVFAAIHEKNIASMKTLKRSGFKEVGTIAAFGHFNKKISI